MFRVLFAAAAAGMAGAQTFPSPQAVPNVCGEYGDMNTCVNDASQSNQQMLALTGITGGTYAFQNKIYNTSNCDDASIILTLFFQGKCIEQ